jgi:hypothetical protein
MLVYNIVNVEDYFATIKGLWDELDYLNIIPCCSCSEFPCNLNKNLIKCEEAHVASHDENFSQVRCTILLLPELPNASHAFRMT